MPEAASTPRAVAPSRAEAQRPRAIRPRSPGRAWSAAVSAATVLGLFSLWWLATTRGWVKPLFLPRPAAVWAAFVQGLTGTADGGSLLADIGWSLFRVITAFVLAVLAGVPAGLAMGTSRIARGVLDPLVEFYRPLPPLAYLPLIIIWFGIGETSKILLIFLACFAPVALAARAGVRSASEEQVNAALSMGATRGQVLRHVILPAALPDILVGLRIGMGVGWTTLVAAEMVAATAGLGQMVLNASNFLRTDIVIMGIVLIGLFAYAFEMAMRQIEKRLVPWKGKG